MRANAHQILGRAGRHDAAAARAALAAALPAALVPRLVLVNELPTRTSGKVDRAALPESAREALTKVLVEATGNMIRHGDPTGPASILIESDPNEVEAVFINRPKRAGSQPSSWMWLATWSYSAKSPTVTNPKPASACACQCNWRSWAAVACSSASVLSPRQKDSSANLHLHSNKVYSD